MELAYINNPRSLFRKYHQLVTLFANSDRGKDFLSQKSFFKPDRKVALFLPNGWHEKVEENTYKTVITTRPIFSPLLYLTLTKIDLALDKWKMSLQDQLEMMFIDLGLKPFSFEYPQVHLVEDTFNPDADPESTSFDGRTFRTGNETFSTIRNGNGSGVLDASGDDLVSMLNASSTTNQYAVLGRVYTLFDTSSIPSGSIIDSGVYSIYTVSVSNDQLNQSIGLVEATTSSNTGATASDYQDSVGHTTLLATAKDVTGLATGGYNDFTLNASGLNAVTAGSITKLGIKGSSDYSNSAPTWSSSHTCRITFRFADQGSSEPKIVINYTLVAKGGNPMFFSSGGNTLG